ncbi:Hypothetical protein POVN_LOCUS148 [uncultured virus]|nr:Hypothetical protein POVN_LOCUS148 [uncultured virus]
MTSTTVDTTPKRELTALEIVNIEAEAEMKAALAELEEIKKQSDAKAAADAKFNRLFNKMNKSKHVASYVPPAAGPQNKRPEFFQGRAGNGKPKLKW